MGTTRQQHRLFQWMKKGAVPLAILMIVIAILFSLFRALTPWAKQYKGEVERQLSALVGQKVSISSMETSWYWFEPVLRLNEIAVADGQDSVLKLNKLLVGINLFSSLWHWHIQPGILYIDDVHLGMWQKGGGWQIDGLNLNKLWVAPSSDSYLPILAWFLSQQKIVIKNVSGVVHLQDGSVIPIGALNLIAVNHNGHYRMKGNAKLLQATETELSLLADFSVLNPYVPSEANGQAYVALHRILPAQWQGLFPQFSHVFKKGKGNVELWLSLRKGHIASIQTTFDFRHLAWSEKGTSKSQLIESVSANLAWKPLNDGWQLSGDKIALTLLGEEWPENALLIEYKKAANSYRIFVKTLLLESLFAADIPWPSSIEPILLAHPQGELHDTQLVLEDGILNYLLTRFTDLGFLGNDRLPSVEKISGALSWQPTEGRLEIDSEEAVIGPKNHPPVTFSGIFAAMDWKELSDGLRISMDRLVLSRKDLAFSASGVLDDARSPTARNLRLNAQFSAESAKQWLSYIPSNYLKVKLDHWIKHDITRIEKASGELVVRGMLADFPFDDKSGEFTINARLSGMDLYFNRRWPLNRDVDAQLRLDRRSLDVDILHANMRGLLVDAVNMHVDSLGNDHETLFVHGKIEPMAENAMAYVFASPLRVPLAKLKMLELKGTLGLDLRLEVPLYPENDDVLVLGTLDFHNNLLTVHHTLHDIEIKHVTGALQFDEHGIKDSELKATLLGYPIGMRVQSFSGKKPYTEVTLKGSTTIDLLRKEYDWPILSFLEGQLRLESHVIMTDDPNDLDRLTIRSPLEGIAIDLPSPLGKLPETAAPLSINADFNPKKGLRLRMNYDNRFSSDLWFKGSKGVFIFDKGDIRIGQEPAVWQKQAGLQVIGTLPTVDTDEWSQVAAKILKGSTALGAVGKVRRVDLTMNEVVILGNHYQGVSLNAGQVSKEEWSLQIAQKDFAANLQYRPSSHLLSGQVEHLYLPKPTITQKQSKPIPTKLKPTDIPNLNISLALIKIGDVDVGNGSIKSTSVKGHWHLEEGLITSPAYQWTITGDWKQDRAQNTTSLSITGRTKDLEQSLDRWHITPVVTAKKGVFQFQGGWPDALTNGSLANLSGQMYLELKNGRITHLSPETEEKLGLGKLLSILSLQTIPRRLKLDFSDLSKGGYSFDTFKGNFALQTGVMTTHDAYIDGPVAYASMKGELDLLKKLYDVDLHISPHITASLPVVATIAGGPIAGMATWVASKIINYGMQEVTGYTYKVSGPWSSPVVQQISIFKKKKRS